MYHLFTELLETITAKIFTNKSDSIHKPVIIKLRENWSTNFLNYLNKCLKTNKSILYI